MRVTGLDGKEYSWNVIKYKGRDSCSKLHLRARNLLAQEFPCDAVYEELTLPGSKGERQNRPLFADFFIPTRKLMIEVQGEQHYKFNSHFFTSKIEFFRATARDRLKAKWCEINQFELVHLPFNEDDEQWLYRIRNR